MEPFERAVLAWIQQMNPNSGDGDEAWGRFQAELQNVPHIYFQSSQSVSIFPSFSPFSPLPVTAHSVISPGCFLMERWGQ